MTKLTELEQQIILAKTNQIVFMKEERLFLNRLLETKLDDVIGLIKNRIRKLDIEIPKAEK